jgi:hypothetical protein
MVSFVMVSKMEKNNKQNFSNNYRNRFCNFANILNSSIFNKIIFNFGMDFINKKLLIAQNNGFYSDCIYHLYG